MSKAPDSESQSLVDELPQLLEELPSDALFFGEEPPQPPCEGVEGMDPKAEIHQLMWKFMHPSCAHDVVESAIKLSTEASNLWGELCRQLITNWCQCSRTP